MSVSERDILAAMSKVMDPELHVDLVKAGMVKDIRLSGDTVKHHLTSIFDKTGASNRLELALLAIRQGVVDAD